MPEQWEITDGGQGARLRARPRRSTSSRRRPACAPAAWPATRCCGSASPAAPTSSSRRWARSSRATATARPSSITATATRSSRSRASEREELFARLSSIRIPAGGRLRAGQLRGRPGAHVLQRRPPRGDRDERRRVVRRRPARARRARPAPGGAHRERALLLQAVLARARPRLLLRRRHHRRRRARPRDRLRADEARHHERRRARDELHRRRRLGPQHDDPARQLQDARGHRVLRREPQDLPAALAGARLQPADLEARPPHAGALGALRRGAARARRGQPADGRRLALGRARRGRAPLPAAQHVARGRLPDPGRALPPAGRRDPPRRGRLGLRAQGRRRRRAHPPGRAGHGPQDRERPLRRRRDQPRARSPPAP